MDLKALLNFLVHWGSVSQSIRQLMETYVVLAINLGTFHGYDMAAAASMRAEGLGYGARYKQSREKRDPLGQVNCGHVSVEVGVVGCL